jgi:Cu+-exporting ATPase
MFYVCPMHSEVRQKQPGRCPKCQMHLVPEGEAAHGHHHHGHAAGEQTPAASAAAPMEVPAGTIYTCPMHPEVQQDHPAIARNAACRWSR